MVNITGLIGNEKGEISLANLIEQVQNDIADNPLKDVSVMIDSIGGNLDVGIAMHKYLLALPNKVTTESVNNCASAASVVFLAGDNRIAGCPVMIHNPYIEKVTGDKKTLEAAAEWIGEKQKECEKIYSDRTKLTPETLSQLMNDETYMSPSQAVSFGFATQSKIIAVAKLNNSNINKKEAKMSKPEKSIGQIIKDLLKGKAQAKAEDKPVVYNMDLSTADGSTLSLEREEGAPQVGDKASPDGVFTMPDGSIITVAEGTITDIAGVQNSAEAEITDQEVNEVVQTIEDLVKERDELLEKNEKLEKDSVQARAVMNAVKMAGGYDKVFGNFKTTYTPQGRTGNVTKNEVQSNTLQDRIRELKEKGGN